MSELPVPFEGRRPARQVVRAARALQQTEDAIYSHELAQRYNAEVDQIDSRAIADVTKAALETEFEVLDWGLEQAAGSQAKAEMVARMVSQQSQIDTARIARRFGG